MRCAGAISYNYFNTPKGWHASASIMPAPPPAVRTGELIMLLKDKLQ
jgi:hypothetical protein